MNALLVALVLAAAPVAPSTAEVAVALPAAKTDGKVSVEKALKTRRTLRTPAAKALPLTDVGQLCWAAQGVTDDKGHRTAPSARATYALELYVLAGNVTGLPAGLYRYRPEKHDLVRVTEGDQRKDFVQAAIGQGWIENAPVVFVVTGSAERQRPKIAERNAEFLAVETGLAAQGLFLQATALGLGGTFVGGFKPDAARAFLKLPATEDVFAVLPIGAK